MRNLLLLSLAFLAFSPLRAQELTVVANEKGKLGYKNQTGVIVIKEIYDFAEPFDQYGLAKVGKGEKYGLINKQGEAVLAIAYDEIDSREAGTPARIKKGKTYGLINPTDGAILLDVKYTYISDYNCYGLAWFTQGGKLAKSDGKQFISGGKMGILNKDGNVLLTPKQKGVFEFSNKTEWAKQPVFGDAELLATFGYLTTDTLLTDCKLLGFSSTPLTTADAGVMDITGNEIIKVKTYSYVSAPHEGRMRYWKAKSKKEFTYGYLDMASGKENDCQTMTENISQVKYITHGDFKGDIAPVNSTSGWYFINKQYEKQKFGFSSVKFAKSGDNGQGYYAGISDNGSVVYSTEGKELLGNLTFTDVELPDANYGTDKNFALNRNGKWGLYSIDGKELIAPKYDYLYSSRYGIYCNKVGKKWGVVDNAGNELVPANYIGIIYPKEPNPTNIWVMTPLDSLYHNYDISKKTMLPKAYVNISSFEDGMAWASPSKDGKTRVEEFPGKGFIIDNANNVLIEKPFPYSYMKEVTAFVISKGGDITRNEANKFMLKLLRGTERYPLNALVPATDWDY